MELSEQYTRTFGGEEINALPLRRYEGKVRIVRSEKQRVAALRHLGACSLLGFDTETRPNFRKGHPANPPALIQLASREAVFVFQLTCVPMCEGIKALMENPAIIKTGVSVRDDVKDLQKLLPFAPGNFVDLGEVARQAGMQTHGLRNLTANLLGFRISKSAQCSNWAREHLSPQQVAYAATDAWVSREIYLAMARLGLVNGVDLSAE